MSSAFDKLARPIQKWIRQQGWRELRDIQARAVHQICDSDADLIIAASTAGGKTEAAFLPLISQLLDRPSDSSGGFDLVYIGPLKALITDQAERLSGLCHETPLAAYPWHGDVAQSVKTKALKEPQGILLITPESLEALFIRRGLEIPRLFAACRAIVIDELHSLLDTERGVQLRSLLTRLEWALKRPIRRIGLSATLGDMNLARGYLRPDGADAVRLLETKGGESELRLQVRGYLEGSSAGAQSAHNAVAAHLFQVLRGSDNLVFAGARNRVEAISDTLRQRCEDERLPQEFFPHHANLSRDHRSFVEQRLKDPTKPTTAVCTSTLELGIDIGDIASVAQIGAPYSVAGLRQRLGRSGRREGSPAILRQYVIESETTPISCFSDRLRLTLLRAVAAIELLLEGWCEPPKPQALHLSTLVHQVLAVIAERGGASAAGLYDLLCQKGPFRQVSQKVFIDLLRALGRPECGLIEQTAQGVLLLGPTGEKLVAHYSFYAVFQTPDEFRLITTEGRVLGVLSVNNILSPGILVIFSGRRWVVREVHDQEKTIVVSPAKAGIPPRFDGDPGEVHDAIVERMFSILADEAVPAYLDPTAQKMLHQARRDYRALGLDKTPIVQIGDNDTLIATKAGTIKTTTLALALRRFDLKVSQFDGFLQVVGSRNGPDVKDVLTHLSQGVGQDILQGAGNLLSEKFHPYLTPELLITDALSAKINLPALKGMVDRLGIRKSGAEG